MRLERKDAWAKMHDESNDIYGYKGFHPGLICRDKQYAVGEIFEESGASQCCSAGVMHYCKHPYDVFEWYSPYIIGSGISEYALVKPLGDICCGKHKYATNKLEIVKKLSLREMLEIGSRIPRTAIKPIYYTFEDGRNSTIQGYYNGMIVIAGSNSSVWCRSNDSCILYYFGNDGKEEIEGNLTSTFLIGDRINLRIKGNCNSVYVAGHDCSVVIDGRWNDVLIDTDDLEPKVSFVGEKDNNLQYMY